MNESVWAPGRHVDDVNDCYFYQSVELPGVGEIAGEWDLRPGLDQYVGGVDVAGRRVLEIGAANGFVGFELEARGAEVVACDLGENDDWDLVPYGGIVPEELRAARRDLARRLTNAWWFSRERLGRSARAVYSPVYDIPSEIGEFDVAIVGSVLLHLQDPFGALHRVSSFVTDTIVVTDMLPVPRRWTIEGLAQPIRRFLLRLGWRGAEVEFVPQPSSGSPVDTWWRLSPTLVSRYLATLGFETLNVTYHRQIHNNPVPTPTPMFTVVARRPRAQRGARSA